MDEIIIEEKKYISSKRAAKITGYAKDYVGQLCREGRVPARLVGRSWYVLESAIRDHRFGDHDMEIKEKEPVVTPEPITKTWEFPRYESVSVEKSIPPLNLLEKEKESTSIEKGDGEISENSQNLHESWKEWFDDNATSPSAVHTAPTINSDIQTEQEELREEALGVKMQDGEVSVPLRVINPYVAEENNEETLAPKLQQNLPAENNVSSSQQEMSRGSSPLFTFIQIGMICVALIIVVFVSFASGYLNKYFISIKQVQEISGTYIYNK